jgi:hypothetical protein
MLSMGMDVYYLILLPIEKRYLTGLHVLLSAVLVSKVAGILSFLAHGQGTGRARKYLDRRLRLFGFPLQLPRRVMRETRSRIVAIELLEVVAIVVFICLFTLSVTSFNYTAFSSSPGSISVSTALFVKIFSTALFAGCLAYDTDFVLALGYFGFLGFIMKYYVGYMQRRRRELGGWPYAYSYNSTRFNICVFAKCIDVCVGVLVWLALRTVPWRGLATDLRVFYGFLLCTMLVCDVWICVLVAGVYWLLGKQSELLELDDEGEGEVSDDSELDELAMRNSESPKKQRRKSGRLKSYPDNLTANRRTDKTNSIPAVTEKQVNRARERLRAAEKRAKLLKNRRELQYYVDKDDVDSNSQGSDSLQDGHASSESDDGDEGDVGPDTGLEHVEINIEPRSRTQSSGQFSGAKARMPFADRLNLRVTTGAANDENIVVDDVTVHPRRLSHSGSDGDRDSAGRDTPTKLLRQYNMQYNRGGVEGSQFDSEQHRLEETSNFGSSRRSGKQAARNPLSRNSIGGDLPSMYVMVSERMTSVLSR